MTSHNSATLVGRLGADPEIKEVGDLDSNGARKQVVNLSVATNRRYKDKNGAQVEITDWHRIVIWNAGLIRVIQAGLLCKGKLVLVQGEIRTRSYEQEGIRKWSTEIVLSGPQSVLTVMEPRGKDEAPFAMSDAEPDMPTAEEAISAKIDTTTNATGSSDIPF